MDHLTGAQHRPGSAVLEPSVSALHIAMRGPASVELTAQQTVGVAQSGSPRPLLPRSAQSHSKANAAPSLASASPTSLSSLAQHSRPGDRIIRSHAGCASFPSLSPSSPSLSSPSSPSPSSSAPPPYVSTTNAVISSKYTPLSFLPLNLFEQFHNVANLYFLLVGVLQAIPAVSTTNGIPTMYEPLAFIVAISSLRAAKEDYDKHVSDAKRNGYLFDVLHSDGFRAARSGDLRVGDVVRIKEGDMVPADCLFLASSHAKGHCFLDKANLNGETRLEVMSAAHTTRQCRSEAALRDAVLELAYEAPNKRFDSFRGWLRCTSASTGERHEAAVDGSALLMRETIVRNTDFLYGLVVYTGNDTKIQRSNLDGERPKVKVSRIMRMVDTLLKAMLALQVALCMLGGILSGVYHDSLASAWYLNMGSADYSSPVTGVLAFFTWFILLSSLVPISLIVSAELVRFTQSVFIQWDVRLYSSALNKAAKCNSSTIHEDLGLIDFVFSDKTGTLTQNRMEFRYALLGQGAREDEFGSKETDIAKSVQSRRRELEQKQGRGKPHIDTGAGPRRERSWVEMERPYHAKRTARDAERGCCTRFFPSFMRACWYTQEERIEVDEADDRWQGPLGGKVSPRVAVSPRQISAHSQPPGQPQHIRLPLPGAARLSPSSTAPPSSFGGRHTTVGPQAPRPSFSASSAPSSASVVSNTFTDAEREHLLSSLWGPHSSPRHKARLYTFLQHMALSNTVKPYEEGGELRFQAESAEELAMVTFARRMGFTKRSINPTVLEVDCYEADDVHRERKRVRVEVYHHVATLGFTSKRARVSVIYQRISERDDRRDDAHQRDSSPHDTATPSNRVSPTLPYSGLSAASPRAAVVTDAVEDLRLGHGRDDDAADTASTPIRTLLQRPLVLQPTASSLIPPTSSSSSTSSSAVSSFPSPDPSPIVVMSKGQDTVILPFMSLGSVDESALLLSLKDMSTNGLRTLVCGHSALPLEWWTIRSERYAAAIGRDQSELSNGHPDKCRKAEGGCEKCAQHELFEDMEEAAQLSYLGTLGLEDQLQPLVPECISDCLKAGIKVWMITGDKLETAKNIGLACNLIDADMLPDVSACGSLQALIDQCGNSRLLEITGQWADLAHSEEDMGRLFDSLDKHSNGVIDHDELIVILRTLRCALGEDRLQRLSLEQRGITRAAFLELMRSTRLSQYDAVKYDVESAIRLYNSIADHSLYPVSILVDRTAFQVMFPSPVKAKDRKQHAEDAAIAGVATDKSLNAPSSTVGAAAVPPSGSPATAVAGAPSADELELLRAKFFELARRSKSVVFARAEPAMKKRMVTEIQARVKDVVTLAIGDGANDCVEEKTLVMLADGRTKAARDVQRGDRLLSTGGRVVTVTSEPFTRPEVVMYRITAVSGESFAVTPGHLVTLRWRGGTTVTCEEADDSRRYRRVNVTWWRADTLTSETRSFRMRLEEDGDVDAHSLLFETMEDAEQWGWEWFHSRFNARADLSEEFASTVICPSDGSLWDGNDSHVDEEMTASISPRVLEDGELIEVRAEHLAKARLFQHLCLPKGGRKALAVLQTVVPSSAAVVDALAIASVALDPTATRSVGWQVDGDGRFVLGNGILTHNCDMIQAAHIGVGIAGVEGTAATNSADYAIGSFRMLHTLLFVHGYWSYQRQARLVTFIFYKASLVALSMFLFGFFSAFSGQQFFDDPNYEIYNVIYTALPILALSVLDQPLPADTLQNHPIVYRRSKHRAFTPRIFFSWIARAFVHAAVLFFFPYAQVGVADVSVESGRPAGLWFFSMIVYLCVVLTPTLLVLFEVSTITLLQLLAVGVSMGALLLITFIINSPLIFSIDPNLSSIVDEIYQCPSAYLLVLVTLAVPLLIELLYRGWQREHHPTITQIFQEREKGLGAPEPDSAAQDSTDGASAVHVPIDLDARQSVVMADDEDAGSSAGDGVAAAAARGSGSADARMDAVKSNLVKAMLRMRNQMGGQFDSAAQAALQSHDHCDVDGPRALRSPRSAQGTEKSVSGVGNRRAAPLSHALHREASAEDSTTAQARISDAETDGLPWHVPSGCPTPHDRLSTTTSNIGM